MSQRPKLREIPFGLNDAADEVCIYDNGHIEPELFLRRVREWQASDVPQDARDGLTLSDVQHIHFRPMSPSEARAWGCDSGVMKTETGGYPVTAVIL